MGPVRQAGFSTLLATLVLLLLLTILSFTAGRIGVQQQRLAGVDQRAREVHEAAEAGLQFALAWLRENTCNQASCDPSVCTTNCFPATTPIGLGSGYSFTPGVSFSMQAGGLMLVRSAAVAAEDGAIRNTVQQIIRQTDLLTPKGRTAPPMVVDGCAVGHTGDPEIFPRPGGKAMVSLDLQGQTLSDCLDTGHFDFLLCRQNAVPTLCTADGGDQIEVTGVAYLGDESASRPATTHAAWDYMFEEPLADAMQRATAAGQVYSVDTNIPGGEAPQIPYIIYDTTQPFTRNGDSIGTAEKPVIIIVPAARGCPTFSGGSVIYGFIYFENETDCLNNGWGGTKVYGSVVYEGDGNSFNADTDLFDIGNLDGGGRNDTTVFLDDVAVALGSWKDW